MALDFNGFRNALLSLVNVKDKYVTAMGSALVGYEAELLMWVVLVVLTQNALCYSTFPSFEESPVRLAFTYLVDNTVLRQLSTNNTV